MTEKYYAIRIGNPLRHHPYLMPTTDNKTPILFATRAEADKFSDRLLATPSRSVVRVQIKFGK